MSPVRIIGVGSPLGQDRLGWQVVDQLQSAAFLDRFPAELISMHQSDRPGAALLSLMRGANCVVIIDALQSGAAPGTIRCLEPQTLAGTAGFVSSHDFGVSAALALGQALGDLPEHVRVLGIEMDPAQSALTPLSHSMLGQVEDIITREINDYCHTSNNLSNQDA